MNFSELRKRVVDHNGCHFYDRRYCIYNEFGPIAFVWSDCEQNAIDEAVDSGHMDSMRMSDEDRAEYAANGWDDSYILAGNASEPFWANYLGITDITKSVIESYNLYKAEFPSDMWPTSQEVALLESNGFEDDSWHNNICVSFIKPCTFHGRPDGTVVHIWVDAINPDNREMSNDRFLVQAYDECEPLGEGFETDNLEEALKIAGEVLNSHED